MPGSLSFSLTQKVGFSALLLPGSCLSLRERAGELARMEDVLSHLA